MKASNLIRPQFHHLRPSQKFAVMAIVVSFFRPQTFFHPQHRLDQLLKKGHFFYLPYILVKNSSPNQPQCSCYLGPGGRATRYLCPLIN